MRPIYGWMGTYTNKEFKILSFNWCPNIANILLFNFFEQKFVQHGPMRIALDWNGLFLLIFKEKNGPIMPLNQNLHQTVTRFGCVGFSMHACGFAVPQMRQFCLFPYPPSSKWASSEKMIFFAKIGIFCKSICAIFFINISQRFSSVYTTIFVWRMDKINYLSNQTWAKCYHSRNKL